MEVDSNASSKTVAVPAPRAKCLLGRKKQEEERKTTHLFYHEKNLKTMPRIKNPTHVVHAYFQNNELTRIQTTYMYNLTHLHLQWNRIEKIEGLNQLYKLRKLYLGNNRISVVENLDGLRCLEELHIQKQSTDAADGLCFDPRSLAEVGSTLRLLDVSDNKIEHTGWLKPLRRLEVLIAKNNRLDDYNEVADALCPLVTVASLDMRGNPMCKKHRYKETVIARCCKLRMLDGANIGSVSRSFLRDFDRACRLRQLNARNKLPPADEGAEEFFDLNIMEGPRTQSAVNVRPPAKSSRNAAAPVIATDSTYSLVPRCFWRNRAVEKAYRRSVAERSPVEPILNQTPQTILTEQLEAFLPLDVPEQQMPKRGILKKPMPMKYI